MYERLSKEKFIEQTQKRILLRKQVLKFKETEVVATINKFDGKVFNKRFNNALIGLLPNKFWNVMPGSSKHDFYITARIYDYDYSLCENLYIRVVLDREGRLMAKESLEDDYSRSLVRQFINDTDKMQEAIERYDEFLESVKRIEELARRYAGEAPYCFKKNIAGIFYL